MVYLAKALFALLHQYRGSISQVSKMQYAQRGFLEILPPIMLKLVMTLAEHPVLSTLVSLINQTRLPHIPIRYHVRCKQGGGSEGAQDKKTLNTHE